jgi:hypothetical protein
MTGLLLGTHVHPATGDEAARQARALASWTALSGVDLVNLQFLDGRIQAEGFETRPAIRLDSRIVTGRAGIRKPLASEVFALLAALAVARGRPYFAFFNCDIRLQPGVVEAITGHDLDGCAFSRMDIDAATLAPLGIELAGVDGFGIRTAWWEREGWRFRPYILGEPVWDNVYCAQMLCHGRGRLQNRVALALHERHRTAWTTSPFAAYTQWLSALDAPYFSRWCEYWSQRRTLDASVSEAEDLALQSRIFVWRPSLVDRVVQQGRVLKAHARYRLAARR